MARKAKTPAKLLEVIKRHECAMAHISELLRVKRTVPIDNQAPHVRTSSEDYLRGLAHGNSAMLENMLFESNCYAGFSYIAETPVSFEGCPPFIPTIGPDHPEYTSWRVRYHSRG